MRPRLRRPLTGSFVTVALVAAAGVLAAVATVRLGDEPLTDQAPAAGVALLVLAAAALTAGARQIARTPADVPLLARPWLAAVALLVALCPWLTWADVGGTPGLALDGWIVLGPEACLVSVVGGAVLAVLAALPHRPWHAAVPLAVGAVLLVAWSTEDTLDDTVFATSLDVGVVIAILLVATVLAARPARPSRPRSPAVPAGRDALVAAVGGLALLALPAAMWGREGIEVIDGDASWEATQYPVSGWELAPVVAALVTVAGLAGLLLALRRARHAEPALRVPPDAAGLIAAGAALAGSSWLPWWNAGHQATAWTVLEWNAWALLAGGVVLALGGAAGVRRPLLAVLPPVAALVLADGVWGVEGALPPTGGAIVAVGAAVLAVATLLRPRPAGAA